MLLELTIKDFAIIDSLHLRLHRLFNVFTGETGAGKSIIIDAVNTLLLYRQMRRRDQELYRAFGFGTEQLLKAFSLSTLYQPSPTSGHLWKMTRVLLMVAAQMEPARYMRRLTRPRRVIYNDCRWMPPAQMRVSHWPRCCASMILRPRMGSSSCHAIFSALLDAPLRASMGARFHSRCCSRWQAGWWISTGRANI